MTLRQYLKTIEKFLQDYLKKAGAEGYVLGLSGGVDSTLVAALARKAVGKDKLLAVVIPIESNPDDLGDALEIANILDINATIFDASDNYRLYMNKFLSNKEVLDKFIKDLNNSGFVNKVERQVN